MDGADGRQPSPAGDQRAEGVSDSSGDGRQGRVPVRFIALGVILLVVAFLGASKLGLFAGESEEKGAGGPGGHGGDGPPPAIVVGHVVEATTTSAPIVLAGTLLPNEQVEITSEVSGKVTSISFSEGRSVRKGSILLRLDDPELTAALRRAEIRVELAELEEKRSAALLERQAISPAEYERVAGELRVAKAEIDLLEAQIDKRVVRAPFSGRIGLRRVSLGSYLTPSTVIATLSNLDRLKVEFSIPESYASRVAVGSRFFFTVDGSSTRGSARVYAVEPSVDRSTRSLTVRATTSSGGGSFVPGQFAAIELPTGVAEPHPVVPSEALIPTIDGTQLFVVEDGLAAVREVEIGVRTESSVEVLEGISAGDTVIVEGIQSVRPGGPVNLRIR